MPEARLTIGNVEILSLNDNEASLPLSDVFPAVPAADWTPYQERYPGGFTDAEHILAHFECYLIRSEGRTILMDTGLGGSLSNPHSVEAMTGGVEGRLLEELDGAERQPRGHQHRLPQSPALRPCGLERHPRAGRRASRHLPQRALPRPSGRLGGVSASRGHGVVPAPLGACRQPPARLRGAGPARRGTISDQRGYCHTEPPATLPGP